MSFPNLIDSTVGGADQPAKFATFLNGTDRYQIQFVLDSDTSSATLLAKKSTNTGATWSSAGSGPVAAWGGSGNPVTYACAQVGTAIYVIYADISSGELAMVFFSMGSDSWSAILDSTLDPAGAIFPQICMTKRGGDLIIVVPGDIVSINDVNHRICCFVVFNLGSGTFSSWTDLDYLDYSDITYWDLIPCGIVSNGTLTSVFMQQVARAGPGDLTILDETSSGTYNVPIPLDAPSSITVEAWGAGAGGNPPGGGGGVPGSGGGGGAYSTGLITVTPGTNLSITVGAGGASGADGEDSSVSTVNAGGGKAGTSGATATGGAGGIGDHNGGAGGDVGAGGITGGGGGGSATSSAAGDPGSSGGVTFGGGGGAGQGQGGQGGNSSPFNPPVQGQPGGAPGGGGGGHGVSDLTPPFDQNNGADGEIILTWTSIRNTHDCRMFQQAIKADNSLGTLTEITEGVLPSRPKDSTLVIVSFDCAIDSSDNVIITFTGVTSTSGITDIAVGLGTIADPISFSIANVTSGSSVDSKPCVCIGVGPEYFLCYISVSSDIKFYYRSSTGGSFGTPNLIGSLSLPDTDMRQFSRLQCSLLDTLPEITFGVPTPATCQLTSLD